MDALTVTSSWTTPIRRFAAGVVALALVSAGLAGCEPVAPYEVAVFGDVPYSESLEAAYDRMIAEINGTDILFSSHLGDFKSSSSECTDANLDENIRRFDSLSRPLIYTPGDNEWLDCGSSRDVRLARIREAVFRGDGASSRGRTTRGLASQAAAGYPENAMWSEPSVTFATLHVVGGGDDQGRSVGQLRRAHTIEWMRSAFRSARDAGHAGIVLLAQDSPYNPDGSVSSSYRDLADALRAETLAFSGEVLWIQGDGHTYRNDQPMRASDGSTVARFRRVQVEGESKVSYVRLRIEPGAAPLFSISLSSRF